MIDCVLNLSIPSFFRVFLVLNPERGSKAEMKGKKRLHIPPRLLKFLNELNDFENPWRVWVFGSSTYTNHLIKDGGEDSFLFIMQWFYSIAVQYFGLFQMLLSHCGKMVSSCHAVKFFVLVRTFINQYLHFNIALQIVESML